MGRLRVFLAVLLTVSASIAFATDYRLVVASDDPAVRKASTIVIFEGTGKLGKNDRITSVTFSAAADVQPNCVVSLDGSSGKYNIPLGPEVQVFKGKAMIAGSKPTNRVIPGYLMVDNPLPVVPNNATKSVMAPIINRVNNIPWLYIGLGVAIFMGVMFLMNRKSQVFTSNMTLEARNLYTETVSKIVDRLERIEASQEQLVKNPPVLRTFKVQIAEFEGRLTRIEKLATESKESLAQSAESAAKSENRFNSLAGFMESAKNEAAQTQLSVKRESEVLRNDLKALAASIDDAKGRLSRVDELGALTKATAEQSKELGTKLDALGGMHAQNSKQSEAQVQQIGGEVQAIKSALAELKAMHDKVAQIVSSLPAELQAVRASIPTLDAVESKLSEIKAFGSKFDQLDEISTKLDHLPEIKGSLDALPSHFPKLDENLVRADFEKLAAQLEALNEIKGTLAALPSQMPKIDEGVAKSKDLEKLFAQLGELSEIKDKLEALPSQMPKMDEGLAKSQDFEKLFSQLSELGEIKDKLEALPSKLPKLDANLAKSHDLEKLSSQLAELKEIKNKLEELPAQMPNLGENLADFQNSLKEQIAGLNGKIDESGANLVELITSTTDEEAGDKKRGKKGKSAKEEEPATEAQPAPAPSSTAPAPPAAGEFSFNNAIRQMNEEGQDLKKKEEEANASPTTFKLGELPDRLETFEDSGPEAVLPTLKVEDEESEAADKEAVELLLMELTAINKPAKEEDDSDDLDEAPLDLDSEDGSRWSGLGGSSSRSWSTHSSRPLELVSFEGELKPITPIETAPSGDPIGAVAFGFGRVLYSCGLKVHGFWPGREGRSIVMDHPVPTDDWRLATNGQSLFVAEPKKVKIVSLQGWFVLEQFNGEYYDQLVTKSHWVGIRNDKGAVMDIRNHRGQPIGEGISLNTGLDGLRVCGHGNRIFTGSSEGVVNEVTELGTEKLGAGPEGARCVHLTFADGAPLAIFNVGGTLEAWHFGDKVRRASLETSSFSGVPMLIGASLYLADVDNHVIVSLDVKKMSLNKIPAFQGVSSLRRVLGVHHKGQHFMFAITTDEGKRGGRLVSIDAKNGWETTFCLVGQANVNLITADHHLVISTSNQYQNLVRVLEPFQLRAAA